MIEYSAGDILKSNCEVLCNPVNCEGVMGKGLAVQFKMAYPAMFEEYKRICLSRLLKAGLVHIYAVPGESNPRYIYNVATKARWEGKSQIATISTAIGWINQLVHDQKVTSIAIPALGCGEGGLKWGDVRLLLERMTWPMRGVNVVLYPPKEEIFSNAKFGRSA